jgi:hypothetical protein
MYDVTITFVSESIINIANATGRDVIFEIGKILSTTGDISLVELPDTLSISNGDDSDYDFGTNTGIFKITSPATPYHLIEESNTIIIVGTIVDELEKDVKEILLADDIQKILPKGYDFITLALLSIIYIGNSPYQNATYDVANLTKYTSIAVAIDRCEKYLDRIDNTPQSSNKLWQ